MEHTLRIRGVEERDRAFVLRVNEENVEVLSPMDEGRLQKFAASAEQFLVAEADGQPAAFLIAIQEGAGLRQRELPLVLRPLRAVPVTLTGW